MGNSLRTPRASTAALREFAAEISSDEREQDSILPFLRASLNKDAQWWEGLGRVVEKVRAALPTLQGADSRTALHIVHIESGAVVCATAPFAVQNCVRGTHRLATSQDMDSWRERETKRLAAAAERAAVLAEQAVADPEGS